jgi:rubrerythrin
VGTSEPRGTTRGQLLRRALTGGGVGLGGLVLAGVPQRVLAKGSSDADVLNLVLLVEQAEVAFYRAALRGGALRGEVARFARTVAAQEEAHAAALRSALGSAARGEPRTDFGQAVRDADRFGQTAARLEDIAVGAYNGGATSLSDRALRIAAEIVSVEARHAAWIRTIIGKPPARETSDDPLTAAQVRDGLREIGVQG